MRRVAITGLGAVTPLGNDAPADVGGARSRAESGIDFIRSFDASRASRCGSPRRSRTSSRRTSSRPKEARRLERNVLLALAAGQRGARRRGAERLRPGAGRHRPRLGDRRLPRDDGAARGAAGARPRPRVAVLPAERAGRLGERAAGDLARDPRPELRGRVRVRDRLAHGRRGRRADPARRRRRRARRRHGGGDAPADPGRLLRDARARRRGGVPAARLAAVRRDAGRLRDRRGRVRARCWRTWRRRRRAARRSTPRCSATARRTTRTTWRSPTRSRSASPR